MVCLFVEWGVEAEHNGKTMLSEGNEGLELEINEFLTEETKKDSEELKVKESVRFVMKSPADNLILSDAAVVGLDCCWLTPTHPPPQRHV